MLDTTALDRGLPTLEIKFSAAVTGPAGGNSE